MRKSNFTEEQINGFLKQAEAGMAVVEICRKGGFSDATFYKWRAKFGDMESSGACHQRASPSNSSHRMATEAIRPQAEPASQKKFLRTHRVRSVDCQGPTPRGGGCSVGVHGVEPLRLSSRQVFFVGGATLHRCGLDRASASEPSVSFAEPA
jgi:hypothetical protein